MKQLTGCMTGWGLLLPARRMAAMARTDCARPIMTLGCADCARPMALAPCTDGARPKRSIFSTDRRLSGSLCACSCSPTGVSSWSRGYHILHSSDRRFEGIRCPSSAPTEYSPAASVPVHVPRPGELMEPRTGSDQHFEGICAHH